MSHDESVPNFVEPKDWNHRALLGEARQNIQAVFSTGLIIKTPLERERSVDNNVTHNRWPS
jgi:hypothetical protein